MNKTWVSSRDSHVRDHHRNMDGRQIPMDELWDCFGSRMEFPGDSSHGAAAGEIIHCRCDEMYNVV